VAFLRVFPKFPVVALKFLIILISFIMSSHEDKF
jgi:hypothetical protein